jgi:hypothetical protein
MSPTESPTAIRLASSNAIVGGDEGQRNKIGDLSHGLISSLT